MEAFRCSHPDVLTVEKVLRVIIDVILEQIYSNGGTNVVNAVVTPKPTGLTPFEKLQVQRRPHVTPQLKAFCKTVKKLMRHWLNI